MRLTVLDDDPGVRIHPGKEPHTVFLDDVEVKYVFTADEEKGEVIAAVLDGCSIVVENGEVKRQTLRGKVRIERIN